MEASFLVIDNLIKKYNDTNALDGVSLTINKGEVFALLGINGAGKTTLSSIIATQHPPTSGDIFFRGVSIYKDLRTYRMALGFCPQQPNLDTYLTVEQNLIFAGCFYAMSSDAAKARADLLLSLYDLGRYRNRKIEELSGGTRQRVLIARALMHSPELVILDEPTVGLDPDIRRQLWDHIAVLRDSGVTVILTTHYLDEAEVLADRICLLRDGKVQLVCSVTDLKNKHDQDSLEEIFIRLSRQEKEKELYESAA
ncbi:MAG: type transport system ATP-binding protein [Candidatus Dependentiae bacterium]|nr:type transport system ATP-binding protein [Candidatus Dependentiae bacterium]